MGREACPKWPEQTVPNEQSRLSQMSTADCPKRAEQTVPNDQSRLSQMTRAEQTVPNEQSRLSQMGREACPNWPEQTVPNEQSRLSQMNSADCLNWAVQTVPNEQCRLSQMSSADCPNWAEQTVPNVTESVALLILVQSWCNLPNTEDFFNLTCTPVCLSIHHFCPCLVYHSYICLRGLLLSTCLLSIFFSLK